MIVRASIKQSTVNFSKKSISRTRKLDSRDYQRWMRAPKTSISFKPREIRLIDRAVVKSPFLFFPARLLREAAILHFLFLVSIRKLADAGVTSIFNLHRGV